MTTDRCAHHCPPRDLDTWVKIQYSTVQYTTVQYCTGYIVSKEEIQYTTVRNTGVLQVCSHEKDPDCKNRQ